ncbi:MAG: hypothetical protein N2422_02330 [Rhodobacteraceae bacterium]|nr:hypothetical protein [Paracoccaceae bacterium]
MKQALLAAGALALAAGDASAGGVERSGQFVGILFEEGNVAQLSFAVGSPDVSGTVGGGALASGDMSPSYLTYSLAYKQALGENLDFAVIIDQPIGADVDYPVGTGYPLQGTTATLSSTAITGLLRYRFDNNVSLYGGLRGETVKGVVSIPLVAGYTLETNRDLAFGYVVGVGWERPDILARVALTYNSAIEHSLDSVEFGAVPTQFQTTVPQSVNLEFQTGISRKAQLLLFGSVRWVDWTEFEIAPPAYLGATGSPLVAYQSDRITYSLGLGKRFSDRWSGAVTLGYEPSNGDITGNLGPVDGFASIGLGATYTMDNVKVTGGLRYIRIGDATTAVVGGDFSGNSALAAGVQITTSF